MVLLPKAEKGRHRDGIGFVQSPKVIIGQSIIRRAGADNALLPQGNNDYLGCLINCFSDEIHAVKTHYRPLGHANLGILLQ